MTSSQFDLLLGRLRLRFWSPMRHCCQRLTLTLLSFLLLMSAGCGSSVVRQQESLFPSPVAYVTAGVLPEPSATPTLPPVEQPTAVPPTPTPRKVPIDSTAAIGLWSDVITSASTFTGVVDIGVGEAIRQMQFTNLALVSMGRRQAHIGLSSSITEVQTSNPEWILYDKNGRVTYSTTDPGEPLLDIREVDVRNQIADDVARRVQAGPYDGILLDAVGVDLIRSANTPVYTGTKAFTADQRRSAVEGLLRSIRAKIPSSLVIVGGYAWGDGAAYNANVSEAQELATLADGVHIENFVRAPISATTTFKSEANWKKDIDYLAAISQDGKVVLVSTRIDDSDVTTDTARVWLNYSVASYLLGKNGPRTYFQFDVNASLALADDPVLTMPIGAPLEAYTKLSSGVYRRQFSNGIVLVNPTAEQISSDLDTEYKLPGFTELLSKVTLPAHSGLILLKP